MTTSAKSKLYTMSNEITKMRTSSKETMRIGAIFIHNTQCSCVLVPVPPLGLKVMCAHPLKQQSQQKLVLTSGSRHFNNAAER